MAKKPLIKLPKPEKSKHTPYVRDLYWFPRSMLNMAVVRDNFSVEFQEDLDETVVLEMFKEQRRGQEQWVGLPRGDVERVRECLLNPKHMKRVLDRRTDAPVRKPRIKFVGEFNPGQERAARILSKTDNGVLKSAPRTGKCLGGNTLVATTHGVLRLKKIKRGALIRDTGSERWWEPGSPIHVAGPDGLREVTAVYTSRAELFRLETTTGHTIDCTVDERFWVRDQGWTRLADLKPGDSVQTGGIALWRSGGRAFPDTCPEFKRAIGPRFNERFSTLLAYRQRMRPERELADGWLVSLQASSACVNYAARLIHYITGVQSRDDTFLFVPRWLWQSLEKFYTPGVISDAIRVSDPACVAAYLRALFESQAFTPWTGPAAWNLDWDLGSEVAAMHTQVLLGNMGVRVVRDGSVLSADPYNSALFIRRLRIRGITIGYHEAAAPVAQVVSVRSLGEQDVYDLSVGQSEDDHNFIANDFLVHNTVMGTEAIIRAGQKSLILAHQTDLIEQFCYETINHDPKDPDEPKLFNGMETRRPFAEICSKYEDFRKYDICLATYQTFLSVKGQILLDKLKHMFGTILVDEVHRAPADRYAGILTRFSARRMWGLTATDDRKDGLWPVVEMIIGPVCHRVKAKSLSARVFALETGVVHKSPPKTWQGIINFLYRNPDRNKLIARTALADVKRGHTVLIPVTTHEHASLIRAEIVRQHGDRRIVFIYDGTIPKDRRTWARNVMRNDRHARIHIAMRSMLTGVNVPRWSAIYTVAPTSNPPGYEQEIFRVCTPMEGKPTPIIRYFYDGVINSSKRWINICSTVLMKPEHAHIITDSFHNLNRSKAAVQRDPDGLDRAPSPGNKRTVPRRF